MTQTSLSPPFSDFNSTFQVPKMEEFLGKRDYTGAMAVLEFNRHSGQGSEEVLNIKKNPMAQSRQLAAWLFVYMIGKMRNTHEQQRVSVSVSDSMIQITILILRPGPYLAQRAEIKELCYSRWTCGWVIALSTWATTNAQCSNMKLSHMQRPHLR